MTKGTVLIVDDDPIILEVARERLERLGYAVETRSEALGTTEYIAKSQPDFVLLDVMMPGLSGDRLAQLLVKQVRTRKIPVILHSSKTAADLEGLVQETGAFGAIEKTSNDARFEADFQRIVARARLHRAHEA